MSTIPYRAWYPISESAQLLGVNPSHLYELIRQGRKTNPPEGAIGPEMVRLVGAKLCLKRGYIFTDEPANLVSFQGSPQVNEKLEAEIAERVLWRFFIALGHAAELQVRTGT